MTRPDERSQAPSPPAPLPPGIEIPAQRGPLPAAPTYPTPTKIPSPFPRPAARPARVPTPAPAEAAPHQPGRGRRRWWAAVAAVLLAPVLAVGIDLARGPAATTAQQPSTPEPATFTPAPASPPIVYAGRDDGVVEIAKDPGPAILQFECARCSGTTRVESDGDDPLLVEAVGGYSGRRLIDMQPGSSTGTVTVRASGSWRMVVSSGLTAARVDTPGVPVVGQGDDVVIVNRASTTAHVTNDGPADFAVHVLPIRTGAMTLAVATTGRYAGTVPLQGPAIVILHSSGEWSLTAGG